MMMKFMAYNKTFPKLYLQPIKEEVFKQERKRKADHGHDHV